MSDEQGPTPLDEAHAALSGAPESDELRQAYYDVLLSGTLYMPVWEEASQGDQISPVVMKNTDGEAVVPVFDTNARCAAWSEEGMRTINLPGFAVFKVFDGQFGLALNIDAPSFRIVGPKEVAWLHDVVDKTGIGGDMGSA